MDMTTNQQVALDEALVPHVSRLRIGRSNFRLQSDISSKESTLQLVYDVMRLTLFFKAFLVTADVLEIYMHELWATAMVHHHSIRFKMDNKKHIVNLDYFREMLHICLRLPAIINKCLSEKSSGYNSLRLSQAQILWGFYHKRNVDFAYLLWEDFIYQVEHKDTKKSNKMYYPRFTKVIIYYFMSKDPSIPRRNKVNWHYVRDDQMFTTIKLVSRHQNTQQFSAMLLIKLINVDIKNSEAYKEYYAVATGATPPKIKASIRKTKSSSDTTVTPPLIAATAMTEAKQLKLATKRSLQQTHISQASGSGVDEGTVMNEMMMMIMMMKEVMIRIKDDDDDQEECNDDDQDSDEEGNSEENLGLNVSREEGQDEEDDEDELYKDVNINLEGRGVQVANVHTTQEFEDSHVTLTLTTSQMDVYAPTTMTHLPLSTPTLTPSTIATITTTLEDNFSEFVEINQFARAVSSILGIVQRYMDQRMNEAVKIIKEQVKEQVKVQVSKILPRIKQTVNEQLEAKVLTRSSNSSKTSYAVAADLSEMELKKILIEKIKGNKSIHRSNEQRNLYKALVEAYESNKIILDTYEDTITLKRRRDDDANKDKEPFPGSDQGSKRRREGKETESASAPKEKATRSAGKSTQGFKYQKTSASESATSKEPMQTTHEMKDPSHPEFETGADDQPIAEPSQHPEWFSQQKKPPTPDHDWNKTLPAIHGSIQPWISELVKQTHSRSSFNELMDTHVDFSAFLVNRLKVDTLTPGKG
nr:hypothetical protein [Tanacetum cinerariifolium]